MPCYNLTALLNTSLSEIQGRFSLYITFPSRRGTSPFSKVFSCVIQTEMFTLTGTFPSHLNSVPSPSVIENV